eukprot:361759-Pelagomonas_calceolata.AAC.1
MIIQVLLVLVMINTNVRAELVAIAAAILQGHSHIATGSLSSLLQIKKQTLHPELHRQHVQGHLFKIILQLLNVPVSIMPMATALVCGL